METKEFDMMDAFGVVTMNKERNMMDDFMEMSDDEREQVKAAAKEVDVQDQVEKLRAEVAKLKTQPKNQRPGKPNDKNQYKLLMKDMKLWGLVPRQQYDISKILSKGMVVGKQYSETEVFEILVDGAGDFPSLVHSTQDVTYLFRYYRGLKNDGVKYAGFVGRDFLKMV